MGKTEKGWAKMPNPWREAMCPIYYILTLLKLARRTLPASRGADLAWTAALAVTALVTAGLVTRAFLVATRLLISDFFSIDIAFSF
jgi:hypothetical protein